MSESAKWALLIVVIVAVGLGISAAMENAKEKGNFPTPSPAVTGTK